MPEIKKIANKVFLLILEILLFTFQTVKQLILPNKKRKGNILSSLLVFFIGVIERLNCFEHGLFKLANVFKLKYLRHSVMVISVFLFFLSSFEWKVNPEFDIKSTATTSLQLSTSSENIVAVNKQKQTIYISANVFLSNIFPECKNDFSVFKVSQPSLEKYLYMHRLRI